MGQPRSIGVSNFGLEDMQKLIKIAKIKPTVNQVSIAAGLVIRLTRLTMP